MRAKNSPIPLFPEQLPITSQVLDQIVNGFSHRHSLLVSVFEWLGAGFDRRRALMAYLKLFENFMGLK